jgi:hypothetical protein
MSQLIDLGKLRFYFAGDWSNTTTYESNDVVKYGGNVYVYTYALKTSGNLPTNTAYWALMIEGFKFKGVFSTATAYKVGDGVAWGGKVYVSVLDSTGQTPPNTTYWSLFADGIQYEGTYSGATAYQKNDVVVYGGSVYIAKQDSTGNLPTVTAYWDKFVEGVSAQGIYNNATAYVPNDLVAYGPNIYRAKVNTTGNLPSDTSKWETLVSGTAYQGTYSNATTYYLNDIVAYGPNLYRSKQTQANTIPTTTASWDLLVGGTTYQGVYVSTTTYYLNDIVTYGSNTYRSKQTQTNVLPTVNTNWEVLNQGFSYQGDWSSSTSYKIGQVITYGGSLFQAITDNSNVNPTTTATWNKLVYGFKNKGDWTTSTQYGIDEVVVYGGNTYISLTPHASTVFANDLSAGRWIKFNSGIRWRGTWAQTIDYLKDDVVKNSIGSAYIATIDHTSTSSFTNDLNAGKWAIFVQGGADVLPAIQADDIGQSLTVKSDGVNIDWIGATQSQNTYYVAPHGTDATGSGKNLATPFASIKYACQIANTVGGAATIYVKTGTYNEQLPIVVPPNVAIVGDNQRTTIVNAKSGVSDDGTTLNSASTMWKLSNGSILNRMTFTGMTGWTTGATAADITTSTVRAVVVGFNSAIPIATKSPYVLECSAICPGAIAALVDGSVHSTGNKSMIFHAYTVISDNGVGFWIKDGGKAEIVSCFTYYAYFGYATTGGGFIRALNGNNSYGTYGAVSSGYDSTETALTGTLVGRVLPFTYTGGNISVGNTVVGATSGATGVVLNVQYSANKLYLKAITGTFQTNENINISGSAIGTVKSAVEDQKGFILVAKGFTSIPKPGSSISLTGDTFSYVIQSTTGTWTSTTSEIVLVLAQEKPSGSADNTAVTVRTKYSQTRLTGHDFLSIGTGGITTTNYPGTPTQPAAQGNETVETFPGRVFYVSTDQDGNYRVGKYFKIDQATGKATLNASAFDLSGLSSLRLGSIGAQLGETINEFSSDPTLADNSNLAIPTEYAVKTYADTKVAKSGGTMTGLLTLSGVPTTDLHAATKLYVDTADALKVDKSGSTMTGLLTLSGAPTVNLHAATKLYVDTAISGIPLLPTHPAAAGAGFLYDTAGTSSWFSADTLFSQNYPRFTATSATSYSFFAGSQSISVFQAVNTGSSSAVTHTLASGSLPSGLSLQTNGLITGTINSGSGTATFSITAVSNSITVTKAFTWTWAVIVPGQALYGTNVGAGTFSWTAPAGITSVSVVAVGGGASGGSSWSYASGSGGGLGWKNNITVIPGNSYTVKVGRGPTYSNGDNYGGNSYFIDITTVAGGGGSHATFGTSEPAVGTRNGYGGGYVGEGGGAGGNASNYQGGGGAGGYTGRGGDNYGGYAPNPTDSGGGGGGGYYSSTYGSGAGGGVGLLGRGATGSGGNYMYNPFQGYNNTYSYGSGGAGGSGGTNGGYGENPFSSTGNYGPVGGTYGGGGGGPGSSGWPGGPGGQGGVRIMWGGGRSFPNNAADV